MLIITGTVRLPPENLAAARPVMAAMVAASRIEDGCIEYAYAEDVLEPGLIRIVEVWRDRAALDAHFETEHLAAWRASWQRLGICDRQLFAYQAGEPQPV
jgi:quinol monooxygenase YgiN